MALSAVTVDATSMGKIFRVEEEGQKDFSLS